jgi:hypothetical protein
VAKFSRQGVKANAANDWTRSERPAHAGQVGMGTNCGCCALALGFLAAIKKCQPFGDGGRGLPQDYRVTRGALSSRPIPLAGVTGLSRYNASYVSPFRSRRGEAGLPGKDWDKPACGLGPLRLN